jgi:hypothetical protein
MNIFNAYNLYECIIIMLSVVKLAIATGHAMQVLNDLCHSKDAGLSA